MEFFILSCFFPPLSIHFNVAPHLKTPNEFFFFFESLIEERASVPQAICVYTAEFYQVFQSLNFTDLAKQTHRYRVLQHSGVAKPCRNVYTCLTHGNMDSKQGLNFWSKSV